MSEDLSQEGESVLVLMAPAARRDDIVDALMAHPAISGFSSSHSAGFSRVHSHLNLRERVQGYGDYERFEVICSHSARESLLRELAAMAGRDHLRYWVLPLLETGVVGTVQD